MVFAWTIVRRQSATLRHSRHETVGDKAAVQCLP